jgi:hypothetical protein
MGRPPHVHFHEPRLVRTLHTEHEGHLVTVDFQLVTGETITVCLGMSAIWTLTQGLSEAFTQWRAS